MELLFCSNPWARRDPEPGLESEADAARQLGLCWHPFGFEAFLAGDYPRAFQFLPAPGRAATPLLYRGWILRPPEYGRLDRELIARGYRLLTRPAAYARALLLPRYHDRLRPHGLIPAAWTRGPDLDAAWDAARSLGPGPWIVKDYVKSAAKERWAEACLIPAGADRAAFDRICRALVAYRGERFEGGFVLRPWVALRRLEESPFGYPVAEEYRLFFWRGELLCASAGDRVGGGWTDFEAFAHLGRTIQSPFFTVDVARTEAGAWVLVEAGDGQVCRLPPHLSAAGFYAALVRAENRLGPRRAPRER